MKPVDFEGKNITYVAPPGCEGNVGNLYVLRTEVPALDGSKHKSTVVISCWELTDEELELLKQTKKVYLSVYAPFQPPVSLEITTPEPLQLEVNYLRAKQN